MALSGAEWLKELEEDPAGTDMLDLDGFLLACDFTCHDHPESGVVVYRHREWGITLSFINGIRTVPTKRLVGILAMVRSNLTREGVI
jgi:hypothetical protein